jgi:hypothetical protein
MSVRGAGQQPADLEAELTAEEPCEACCLVAETAEPAVRALAEVHVRPR